MFLQPTERDVEAIQPVLAMAHDGEALKTALAATAGLLAHVYGHAEAASILRNVARALEPHKPASAKMREICGAVAEKYSLAVDDLRGPSQRDRFSLPRQEAMYEMWLTGWWSLPQIGRFLGGRHHTTVLHGVRAHQRRMVG